MKKGQAADIVRDFIYDSNSSHLLFRQIDSVNESIIYEVRTRRRVQVYGIKNTKCKKVTYIPFRVRNFLISINKEEIFF